MISTFYSIQYCGLISYSEVKDLADDYPSVTASSKQKLTGSKKLFANVIFLISGLAKDSGSESTSSYNHIAELIKSNGGKVIDEVNWAYPTSIIQKKTRSDGLPKTIMIAENARRTMKFLLALASGTPCVHYNWILHCVEQEAVLPFEKYLLPAGVSKETGEMVYR
jgi:hypothetical protein